MEAKTHVYVDLGETSILVGPLWPRSRKGQESASFEYQKTWLENPKRFSLEPALMLGPGPYHTDVGKALFGAIGDSAPDRWGRALMRRRDEGRPSQVQLTPRVSRLRKPVARPGRRKSHRTPLRRSVKFRSDRSPHTTQNPESSGESVAEY